MIVKTSEVLHDIGAVSRKLRTSSGQRYSRADPCGRNHPCGTERWLAL